MPIHTRVSGAWKQAKPFVRVSGAWKSAKAYVRVSGVWKPVDAPPVLTFGARQSDGGDRTVYTFTAVPIGTSTL